MFFTHFLLLFIVLFGDLHNASNAFVMSRRSSHSKHIQPIAATYDPYDGSSSSRGRDGLDRNKARMDLRNFLTQRSIQSFVFLLNQCREEHTVRWLEIKLDFKKIDSFHGTGAFNVTLFPEWDSLFLELANQDPETVIIEVKQKRSHRGWGHQNSYVNSISSSSVSDGSGDHRSSSYPTSPSRSRGIAGNYLSNLSKNPTLSTSSQEAKPNKKQIPTGVSGNYLEALSQQTPETSQVPRRHRRTKRTGRKTRRERETLQIQKKLSPEIEPPTQPSSPKLGIQAGYLETLLSNTIENTSEDLSLGHRENPHLEEKSIEYHFDIDPPSLVTRMISVREQISKEWKEDLDTLVRTNDRILDEHEENQRKSDVAALDDDETDEEEEIGLSKHLVSPYQPSQEGNTLRYDRNAMAYLTNSIANQDRASSPFRKSNFDLLLLLCTQESIHRVLCDYNEDSEDEMHMEKYTWLHSFYKRNIDQYFDGHEHSFGRADKFLETLLLQPPIALETRKGGLYLIDPVAIAEDILRERSVVAREWKSIVATIPDEHLDLRRILFTRHLMEVTDWKISGIGSNSLHIEDQAAHEQGIFE